MRLARKFTLTLLLGMCAVLATAGYSTVLREIALFETDMTHDHEAMGQAVAKAVVGFWRLSGEEKALDFIKEANRQQTRVSIRWVPLDGPPGSAEAGLDRQALDRLAQGVEMVRRDERWQPGARQHTYIPVSGPGIRGALDLSESLEEERRYIQSTLLQTLIVTGAIVGVCGLLAMFLGGWFVGRPVRSLIRKARRVGEGDLSGKLELRQRDELSELAGEINAMCDRLAAAKEKIAHETSARIASIEQLRHADRLMTVGKLASGIAHELGTPLNVVWAHAQMISSREVADREAEGAGRVIAEQAERMTRIIRQLLDFARPHRPEKARTDLCQLARLTLGLLTPIAEKQQVSLSFSGEGEVDAEVDANQIQQVLSNLVVNGIQSMRRGGRLTVGARRERVVPPADHGGAEAEYVCLYVEDQGEGIPPENLARIFEPFFTTKDVGEGSGLGLSVSCGIVREHGGWIGVQSRLKAGSLFSIYLPEGSNGCAGES
jgi:two-component system NtrC family sensor kinase